MLLSSVAWLLQYDRLHCPVPFANYHFAQSIRAKVALGVYDRLSYVTILFGMALKFDFFRLVFRALSDY